MLAKCDDIVMGRKKHLRRREQDRLRNMHVAKRETPEYVDY